ncbi:MAG TPA: tetratricopeptide repeat protein [Myxococcaceae bacterium]|nr:tetratricopeptide repeat protein [Myxococcaceae bacterium]
MTRLLSVLACGLLALGASGCKDPEVVAAENRVATAQKQLILGRRLLAEGQADQAIGPLKAATSVLPDDPTPWLLLAEAQREAGNETAAILALKQAQSLTKNAEPSLKRRLVELYTQEGHDAQAVAVMLELRAANQLTDAETLSLAQLQARVGDVDGAFKTLEDVQRARPDDPEAKVVEAEILLLNGDEVAATKIMDRMVTTSPGLVSARVMRARYFLNNGYAEVAEKELAALTGESARRPEVVELHARILNQLQRYEEAQAALVPLMQSNPRDVNVIAQLAEVKLNLGQTSDAESLVDKALAIRPKLARALYVRGRAMEVEGNLERAFDVYRTALESSPGFAPVLSRVWRIQQRQGKKVDAMSTLERLFFLNEASIEEKATLAELYADAKLHPSRARKLIEEALRRDPNNARYKEISRQLGRSQAHHNSGPQIIRMR